MIKKYKPASGRRSALDPGISRICPEQQLANAIVLQAVYDYRKVIRFLRRHPKDESTMGKKRSIESFFASQEFGIYTDADGMSIARRICAEELRHSAPRQKSVRLTKFSKRKKQNGGKKNERFA